MKDLRAETKTVGGEDQNREKGKSSACHKNYGITPLDARSIQERESERNSQPNPDITGHLVVGRK